MCDLSHTRLAHNTNSLRVMHPQKNPNFVTGLVLALSLFLLLGRCFVDASCSDALATTWRGVVTAGAWVIVCATAFTVGGLVVLGCLHFWHDD